MTEWEEIFELLANGDSISSICLKYDITHYHLKMCAASDTLLSQKLKQAQEFASEMKLDGVYAKIESAEDMLGLNKAKLYTETAKWSATKLSRETYGDRMDVQVTQTLDLTAILNAANSRIAPAQHQRSDVIDVSPAITSESRQTPSGFEPVDNKKVESIDDLL